jgi:hypothetical protein
MRKIFLFLVSVFLISSSVINGMSGFTDSAGSNDRKSEKQETVKKAVESKSFVIELEKMYMPSYGNVDLIQENNYILIDGNMTDISAGYIGRQMSSHAIAGIKVTGIPSSYRIKKDDSKGKYVIEMEIKSETDTFHIIMTINKDGYCTALISGMKMDETKYSGNLVPLEKKVREPDAIKI